MPITEDGNGVVQYTAPADKKQFDETGVVKHGDFAICHPKNHVKQITFSVNPTTTTPGTLTLLAEIGSSSTVNLTSLVPSAPFDGATFYVNRNRADTYTPDGSFGKPYKTIQAAIDALATAGGVGIIDIAYGAYTENITLNNSSLSNVVIQGNGASLIPASGDALSSTTNNSNLSYLAIYNLGLGSVNLVGDGAGNSFLGVGSIFQNVGITGLTAQSLGTLYIVDAREVGNVSVVNVVDFEIRGGQAVIGTLSVDTNLAGVQPAGFGGNFVLIENTVVTGGTLTVDDGSYVQFRRSTRFGAAGSTLTVQSGGELETYSSYIRSNIVVDAGGVYTNYGSFWQGTMTSSGTFTNNTFSQGVGYTPANNANWSGVPADVKTALDQLASRVKALGG